jgi:hypothetical protein
MISRTQLEQGGNLLPYSGDAPEASRSLESSGFGITKEVLTAAEVEDLRREVLNLFDGSRPDVRAPNAPSSNESPHRYEALNRSAAAQAAVANPAILAVVEPLLGQDCHVIANTAWRNEPGAPVESGWHTDAGPHIPRPAGIQWDERIPYPIFVIGCHILLQDCDLDSGPTGFVPRSHTSGQVVPAPDENGTLSYLGNEPVTLTGNAGDVIFFVSDVWHRRTPTGPNDNGRLFLQVHYGRRDIAQRLRPTAEASHLSADAIGRAQTLRQRTLVGLHNPSFYDG